MDMNNNIDMNEIRDCFNKIIAIETNPSKIATLELLREYYTNPEFKKALEDMCYEMTNFNPSYN